MIYFAFFGGVGGFCLKRCLLRLRGDFGLEFGQQLCPLIFNQLELR